MAQRREIPGDLYKPYDGRASAKKGLWFTCSGICLMLAATALAAEQIDSLSQTILWLLAFGGFWVCLTRTGELSTLRGLPGVPEFATFLALMSILIRWGNHVSWPDNPQLGRTLRSVAGLVSLLPLLLAAYRSIDPLGRWFFGLVGGALTLLGLLFLVLSLWYTPDEMPHSHPALIAIVIFLAVAPLPCGMVIGARSQWQAVPRLIHTLRHGAKRQRRAAAIALRLASYQEPPWLYTGYPKFVRWLFFRPNFELVIRDVVSALREVHEDEDAVVRFQAERALLGVKAQRG